MARTNNLTNFLTDVADAIRTKTGGSAAISASNFDTEIENIPSGSSRDWSAIGFNEEPTSIGDDYQYSVDKKTDWDTTTTTMPTSKFKDANLVYMPDLDMRAITTDGAFEGTFNLTSNNQLKAVAKIKANPYGSIKNMFNGCKVLTQVDLSELDTTHVTNMNSMFYNCNKLASLDLSTFTTNSVTDMGSMFYNCKSLSSLNLSSFNTSEVTNMNAMLYGVSSIASLNLSNFDTSRVSNMGHMFYGDTALTSLDISSFSNPTIANISLTYMFGSCTSLTHIDMRNLIFSGITTSSNYTGIFGADASTGVPDNCEIIVKDNTEKTWINTKFPRLTNVKTVAEYEAEQNA